MFQETSHRRKACEVERTHRIFLILIANRVTLIEYATDNYIKFISSFLGELLFYFVSCVYNTNTNCKIKMKE